MNKPSALRHALMRLWLLLTGQARLLVTIEATPNPHRKRQCRLCWDWSRCYVEPCPHCGNMGGLDLPPQFWRT